MTTSVIPQTTDFSRDVLGRYLCNGLDEALASTDTRQRPDARPFNIVIVGGGTFGAAAAEHLWFRDRCHRHRILVLEGGPFILPEHVQNLPLIGLDPPPPATADPGPRNEVWGLPWNSKVSKGFPGLAYCLGGRSLFWGGWSPRPIDMPPRPGSPVETELPRELWPEAVVSVLNNRYFNEAARQLGVTVSNDFIHGPLHEAMRHQLFAAVQAGQISGAIPLEELTLHLEVPPATTARRRNELKLEAPLAVQAHPPRSGSFPLNKFSAVPILLKAARAAWREASGDDFKKRLMVVPNCHAIRLLTTQDATGWRVTAVQTNLGVVPLPADGLAIISLGTIESARLALLSFPSLPNADLIGRNLMVHLRSNLDIRIPRECLTGLDPAVMELQTSALFLKGRHRHQDGTDGHFHLQITASGLGRAGTDSEAELWKKIPDIDGLQVLEETDDTHVIITIRGIGEMQPHNPDSCVMLDMTSPSDEFGAPRALVSIADPLDSERRAGNPWSAKDFALWEAMDNAAQEVALAFAGRHPERLEQLGRRRDGLGTTHHETGVLWMGADPAGSVTNPDGRFHHVSNAYVVGPAVFPTIGSPNPMLTGISLTRRLGDRLAKPTPYAPGTEESAAGYKVLFNGFDAGLWRMSTIRNQPGRDNPGQFFIVDGALEAAPATDIGLFWYTEPSPANFILRLQWRTWNDGDNSGVFVRFPRPESSGYDNTAYVAVDFGFEVQIDERGGGASPAGHDVDARFRRTGAIYNEDTQDLTPRAALPPGSWNEFEIRVEGQNYTVLLNGERVTRFRNLHAGRGLPTSPGVPSFIGLQTHTGRVAFRNIRLRPL